MNKRIRSVVYRSDRNIIAFNYINEKSSMFTPGYESHYRFFMAVNKLVNSGKVDIDLFHNGFTIHNNTYKVPTFIRLNYVNRPPLNY
jgi:hypothetical protein